MQRVAMVLAALLVTKITASVVLDYRDYFPANFDSDFLRGREAYFAAHPHAVRAPERR